MSVRLLKNWMWCLGLLVMAACSDEEVVQDDAPVIPEQPAEIASVIDQYNADIAAMQALFEGDAEVVNYTQEESGAYRLELSDGKIATAVSRAEDDADIPLFGVNEEGYWTVQLNGESGLLTDMAGNSVPALRKTGKGVYTPQVALGEDGYWQVSLNGNQWKRLSDTPAADMTGKTSANFSLYKSVEMDGSGQLTLSLRNGEASVTVDASASSSAEAWKKFVMGSEDNVLLDYSYAGYKHGEEAPADGFAWGYEVINVKDYMNAHSMTAHDAFEAILDENSLIRKSNSSATNANARIVIYFPEGDYVLQEKGNTERPYLIYGGNFIIKGDGPDKTRLIMDNHIGTNEASTGALISIGHSNSPRNTANSPSRATVTANASKGDFSVKVSSTTDIKPEEWVQLRLRSNDDGLLQKELGPLYDYRSGWSITNVPGYDSNGKSEDRNGVQIIEFHQVKSVGNGTVTFYEPIMSDIDVSIKDFNNGWEIRQFKYYENVGVEDLAFVGGESMLTPYYHHGEGVDTSLAWMYDYAYKPLLLNRMVNSWVRNVTFDSVSEAVTFDQSANCSAYNIRIEGKRGHSAVRAQESSRVFIGKVRDESSDDVAHGQYHGCGVSKPSIGTVVWNCTWGTEACFESHATQPRATLFDKCSGGLVYYHAGGAATEAPNHLRDLTIWNLNVTGTTDEKGRSFSNDFHWWLPNDTWWKIYPPIVVGVHGASVDFTDEPDQLTYEESTGAMVTPESLYEAQLERRLGYVPAWLNAIK